MVVSHFFTVFRATLNLKNTREDRKRLARYRRYGKIFCFTGALIHATIVTMEFLKFPTTTNVLITNPSTAELSSISLCFFYKLRELKLIPTENGLDRSTLTLKEMNEKLLKWENFVLKCEVLDEEYKPRNCSDISPQVTEYLSIYSKCYTLFESLDPPINYRRTSIGSHFMATIVLEVKNIFTNKIGIFVNHRASLVQESLGQPSFLIFDSFYSNRAGVTFDRVKIKRLAPPYDSRCRDYRKEKCADRQTCITKCINERSYRQNKTWSARRYVEVKVGYYDGRFTSDDDRKIVENCFKRYSSLPCTEYLYNALATNEYMSPFDTNDTFRIDLAYPTGKDTVVEYIALQSWIDFICFVASIANMWTEMSMIRITRWTLEYFSKWAPEIRWPEPKEDGHGKRNKRLYDRNNNLGGKDKSYRSLWSLSDSQRQSIMKNRKISSNVSGNQYIS